MRSGQGAQAMSTCTICNSPTAEPTATMTVDDRALEICEPCSAWGYLRGAENLTGTRAADRLQGARNSVKWAREHAATVERWKRSWEVVR